MIVHPREGRFHERANRVVIRHHLGDVVCAIEVVSPGNKAGKIAIREFVAKAVDFLRRGINLLVVDPFPPGPQDPQTLHKLIWDEFDEGVPFELPADEPLLLASYRAAAPLVEFTPEAFIEPLRVGAELPRHARLAGHRFVRERAARANVQGGLGCVPGRLPAPRRTRHTAGRERAAGMSAALGPAPGRGRLGSPDASASDSLLGCGGHAEADLVDARSPARTCRGTRAGRTPGSIPRPLPG